MTVTDAILYLNFRHDGEVGISERGQSHENNTWTTDELVDENHWVDFELYFAHGGIRFQMDAYHVENPKTKRAFHTRLECVLDRDEIKKIKQFIELCLDNESLLTPERTEDEDE